MPAYDYRCTACNHQFEVRHGITQAGPTKCPACGKKVKRMLSAAAIHCRYAAGHAREHRGRGY
jgi:putative FmdB family regulatory protein